ncbi:MAG: GntR family transcriptional regulator [Chloroflexi bacterium]|nr:GntR family transcriptional regulator [Chloroflexota bacterium]
MAIEIVDPHNVIPKYHQLYQILRHKIEAGEWGVHQAIPSERELEETYGVSRMTVRLAINLLVNQGFLYREQGRGTFVSLPVQQFSLNNLSGFSEDLKRHGYKPGQKLLQFSYLEADSEIQKQLELAPGDTRVLMIERLRFADDEPIGMDISYLPSFIGNNITQEDLTATGSLYRLLQEKMGVAPTEADEFMEITQPDEREAGLLGVSIGSPLLEIHRKVWAQDRRVIEYVRIIYRANRYKYYVHKVRSSL